MSYEASSIKILKGLEGVKKRPDMYIGDTSDGSGLHHMIYEVVDNAIDESLAGFCNNICVKVYKDNSVSIEDNGRGIPTDIHPEEKISAAEVIMTQLHAGGKFDQNSYKVSGGLHGVGISVVNALSEYLEVTIYKNKEKHYMKFIEGIRENPLKFIDKTSKRGSHIKFKPSLKIFSHDNFNASILLKRFQELAFLNPQISILFIDERSDLKENFHYGGGLNSFIKHVCKSKNILSDVLYISGEDNFDSSEISLCWTSSYKEEILCFTNMVPQRDGGSHLSGFKIALTKAINNYLEKEEKKSKITLTGEDIREGIVAIISVKTSSPKFASQTKDKLVSNEVKNLIEKTVFQNVQKWMEENPEQSQKIVKKMCEAAAAREAARKAKEISRKTNSLETFSLPGKLSDCGSKNPDEKELFIVEGNSAGGSAKSCRNRNYQAVLPLRGKIINVERANFEKILGYEGIRHIISALGTGVGDSFNIDKIRYKKVIIMTDADVDGSHIRVLLLTFFYRYMPSIIEKGYLYIAQPPLYGLKKGRKTAYLKDDKELNEHIIKSASKEYNMYLGEKKLEIRESKKLLQNILTFVKVCDVWGSTLNTPYLLENLLLSEAFTYTSKTLDIEKLLNRLNSEQQSPIYNKEKNNTIYKIHKNIKSKYILSENILKHKEDIFIWNSTLVKYFLSGISIEIKDQKIPFTSPSALLSELSQEIFKGVYIQRYKGIGEMPVKDLAETTFEPKNRNLLKVNVSSEEEINQTFNILMGESVEPRRVFIQDNALKTKNLDI